MNILENEISVLLLQKRRIYVLWDTLKDVLECKVTDAGGKKAFQIPAELHDFITDRAIDKIHFDTEPQEYTSGKGEIFLEDGVLRFKYISNGKFFFSAAPETIHIPFEHLQEVKKNLNRSALQLSFSYTEKGFMRMDMRPLIEEGDAYTFGTQVVEKYRSYFLNVLKVLFAALPVRPGSLQHALALDILLRTGEEQTYTKVHSWYEMVTEENLLAF